MKNPNINGFYAENKSTIASVYIYQLIRLFCLRNNMQSYIATFKYYRKLLMESNNRKLLNSPYLPFGTSNLRTITTLQQTSSIKCNDQLADPAQNLSVIDPPDHHPCGYQSLQDKVLYLEMENNQLKAERDLHITEIERLKLQNLMMKEKLMNCEEQPYKEMVGIMENRQEERGESETRKLIKSINQQLEQVIVNYASQHPNLISQLLAGQQFQNSQQAMNRLMDKLRFKIEA